MKAKGKRRSEGSKGRQWLHVKVAAGEKWGAWIAGSPVCVESHHVGATQPCLKAYLGRHARCPGCDEPSRVQDQYAQPVYRELDGRPAFVWLHDDVADAMEIAKLHQYCVVGRTEEPKTGIYLSLKLAGPKYHTTLPERMVEADCSDYLPVVFGLTSTITGQMLRDGPAYSLPSVTAVPSVKPPKIKKGGPEEKKAAQDANSRITVGGKSLAEINAIEDEDRRRRNQEFARENGNGKPAHG